MTAVGKKKYILPLTGLLIAIFAGLGIYLYINYLLSTPITIEDIKVDADAALKLNFLEQVSKKNGRTEWELKASSATLSKSQEKAVLEDVNVVFHTKDGDVVTLTSDRGILMTQTHDITFLKNVKVHYQGYTLTSETLQYDKKPHIIHTDSRVRIEDGESVIEGDSMVTDLNESRTVFKGNVKGRFSENIDLP